MEAEVDRQVFRSGAARVGAYVWFAIALANLGDIAWRGSGRSAWVALAVILLASAVVYVLAYRPAVLVDAEQVVVRNPARTVEVPWPAVTGVDATDALRVHTADGVHRAWAVQVGNRTRMRAQRQVGLGAGPGQAPSDDVKAALTGRTHADFVAEQIRERWQEARRTTLPADAAPRVAWHAPGLAALLLTAGLLVVVAVGG